MVQVLYLMATHSCGRSQFRHSKSWKMRYSQVILRESADLQVRRPRSADIHGGAPFRRCRPQFHSLQCRKVRARGNLYEWSMIFSPTYLILWFWSVVLHPKILIQGIGFMVLCYYGFGPWYCERLAYKKEMRSLGYTLVKFEYLKI